MFQLYLKIITILLIVKKLSHASRERSMAEPMFIDRLYLQHYQKPKQFLMMSEMQPKLRLKPQKPKLLHIVRLPPYCISTIKALNYFVDRYYYNMRKKRFQAVSYGRKNGICSHHIHAVSYNIQSSRNNLIYERIMIYGRYLYCCRRR